MATRSNIPPHSVVDAAVAAARAARDVLTRGLGTPLGRVEAKARRHDPVTAYDREADRVIADTLLAALPEAAFVSEERAPIPGRGACTWVVDPLDGTNSSLRGAPESAVSIALVDAAGPAVACVDDPLRDEPFTAERGKGAERNGTTLRVSSNATLDGAVHGVGSSAEPARRAPTLAQLPSLARHVRALRIIGPAALDLAYVAAARFDATWYPSLHDLDVAASQLLVAEAGGRVTNLEGFPLRSSSDKGVLASNVALHSAPLAAVRIPRPS